MGLHYLEKAEVIVSSLDLAGLREVGISRDEREYDFVAHYPPPLTLPRFIDDPIIYEK